MHIVRIAGLMRSGSNLLTWMLRNNFESVGTATMLLGWKHGPLHRGKHELTLDDFVDPRYCENIRAFVHDHPERWERMTEGEFFQAAARQLAADAYAVALAVRDPAVWYASCLRVSRERPEFLNHGVKPAEAARVWNQSHQHWLDNLGTRGTVVDTEKLRATPELVLEQIEADLGLQRTSELAVPEGYIRPRSQEELYDLLGMPAERHYSARKFTQARDDDEHMRTEFIGLLDADVLDRLGLKACRSACNE